MIRVLNFTMVGHFVLHDFVGGARVAVEGGEHGAEGGFGHAGKADKVLTGIDGDILDERLECFASSVVMVMTRLGEPDEVIRSVVELIAIEMMAYLSFAR